MIQPSANLAQLVQAKKVRDPNEILFRYKAEL